ncbi:uncharacterized protein LOC133795285 [Humulus lupulus]|uniref:uncharacterized protein LOC133795285 n=1 Tax=Humulus lupulus TaxID=3486 RepID=UPI002B40F59C|nr:uncharacterized protein LOC133795285 [Humulus lupulus]
MNNGMQTVAPATMSPPMQTFFSRKLSTMDKQTRRVLLQERLKDGIYQFAIPTAHTDQPSNYFQSKKLISTHALLSQSSQSKSLNSKKDVWHRRLGHPSNRVLSQVLNSLNVKTNENDHFCDACQFGKSHALLLSPFPGRALGLRPGPRTEDRLGVWAWPKVPWFEYRPRGLVRTRDSRLGPFGGVRDVPPGSSSA